MSESLIRPLNGSFSSKTSGISIVVATTVGGQSSGSTLMMEAP
jgi:hypothetical protein